MQLIDLRSLCCFIVFAHVTESKVYVLRDYDDEPVYIVENRGENDDSEVVKHQVLSSSSYKPKRTFKRNTKHAILHYGRHIYHLDDFDDLTKLRSKLAAAPEIISYDYLDFNDLIRSSLKSIPLNYIQDFVILSGSPNLIKCKGKKCDESLRKHNKAIKKLKEREPDSNEEWKWKKMPTGTMKRFKIIDNKNSHKSFKKKKRIDSSEERETKKKKKNKHKRESKTYSESNSNESRESKESWKSKESRESWKSKEITSKESWKSKESNSESQERKSNKRKKKSIYDPNYTSSEERTEHTTKKSKTYDSHSESNSWEQKWDDTLNSESNSIENSKKKKKKKKKKKTSPEDNEFILQGNKLYNVNDMDDDTDRRRRLSQFLPKRYHWEASQIHDLGYYWFNGPKGRYAEPTPLMDKKK